MSRHAPRVLSTRLEAVEYVHATDGRRYRHDFTHADSRVLLNADGSVTVRNPRRRLWGMYDGTPFLENPTGRRDMTTKKSGRTRARGATRARKRRPVPKGYSSWKTYMASIRPGASGKRSARRRKAAQRSSSTGVNPVKAKRKSSKRRRRNPVAANPRRRARRYRRNPSTFSPRNIVNATIDGALHGAYVVAGKAAARLGRQQLGYPPGSVIGSAIEAGIAVAGGLLAQRFLGADAARFIAAGAFAAPIESLVRSAGVPLVSDALGDAGDYDTIAAYPSASLPGDGAYTPDSTIGAYPGSDQLGSYAPMYLMA